MAYLSRAFTADPPAGFIVPCQPLLVDKPPAGADWLHEIKHDGYRIIARKEGSRATLWSRHGTKRADRAPLRARPGDPNGGKAPDFASGWFNRSEYGPSAAAQQGALG